jgi:short-chain fatty acids transporter
MAFTVGALGERVSAVFRRTAPDPFVIAIGLSALTAILALVFGRYPDTTASIGARVVHLLDAWRGDEGVWKLLAFGMQMCLILVTGHALATTRAVRAAIDRLAALPRSTAQAAALVSGVACLTAMLNWGLCLVVGAFLAREVGRSMAARGRIAHYPLIAASGYTGMMVWHGGLSGSAPLSMTTRADAAKVLPPDVIGRLDAEAHEAGLDGFAGFPLADTLFSPMNLAITIGLLVLVPIVMASLAPREGAAAAPPPIAPLDPATSASTTSNAPAEIDDESTGMASVLDRSWVLSWLLAFALLAALVRYAQVSGIGNIGLNVVNGGMIALGLLLHGSPRRYMAAIEDAARGCAGIIIQFPLYAGIMALMVSSQLVNRIAEGMTAWASPDTIPLFTFASASVVNLFIPSGGGQWAVQGPIALRTAFDAGIDPGRMIMAVAYGDQLTNMLQPFWALPLLAITGVKAREIVGYTAIVMVTAGAWIAVGLWLF